MKYPLGLFIRRPILASIISIAIVICGLVAAFTLPVAQYPNISPPSIYISASYPGATAETIQRTVAAQIERQMSGIDNLLYMASTSDSDGNAGIRLTFEVGTDLNYTINEVLNRISAASPLLPSIVQQLGVQARKSSPDMLMIIGFYSDGRLDPNFMSNYLSRTVYNDLTLIDGVGLVSRFGVSGYAIRIWLDLNKMKSLNVAPSDIVAAIKEQNVENVIGTANDAPIDYKINPGNRPELSLNIIGSQLYSNASDFANIVIRQNGMQQVKIKDVARVELGSNSYSVIAQTNFRQDNGRIAHYTAMGMPIFLDQSSNQLIVKKRVLERLKEDAKYFPSGLHYRISFDASQFVSASIQNVIHALRDAFLLVALVILLFLCDIRASVIALIAIPVSIIGAFIFLYLLGYSINTLTLFALILAIGIVVDDAIVVLENIERLKGKADQTFSNREDVYQVLNLAMHEVFGAIVAIALVLSVVFIPVMTLQGLSGVLYKQFAVTIAFTVLISALVALTLTPALSGVSTGLSFPRLRESMFKRIFAFSGKILEKVTNVYIYLAEKIIDLKYYSLAILVLTIACVVIIFKLIPLSFVPIEDQGYFIAGVNLAPASSLEQTKIVTDKIVDGIMQNAAINETFSVIGYNMLNGGSSNSYASTLFVLLKPWDQRNLKFDNADNLIKRINFTNLTNKSANILAFNQPPIRGLSTTGGVEFYLEARTGSDVKELEQVSKQLSAKLMQHKEVQKAFQLLDTNVPQMYVNVDVARTKYYHVNVSDVYSTLNTVFSNNNVNFAYIMQDLVWVILEADYQYRKDINNLRNIYIRSSTGQLVPLNSLVKVSLTKGPAIIERFNDYLATKVTAIPASGYSSGDVMNVITQEMHNLPSGYDLDWFGSSFQQKQSQHTSTLAIIFSLLMIYLLLAALYELWRLPLVVLMGMPFAFLGSGVMLLLRHQPNDLYFQISLLALMGLSAKNIILLIEFALQHFKQGYSAKDSALYALRVRFRPIVMTSITFLVGALPLVFATGVGANAEHSVGTGIVGGILGSVIFAPLVVPAYFVLIMGGLTAESQPNSPVDTKDN